MKIVFCGTPAFAVPALKYVLHAGHDLALVVTQPDRPSGRGMQVTPPPVKQAALDAGLPVVQPEKIRKNEEFRARLESLRPDAILVVAYGRIIPKWMLDLPRHGNLNLHASLLPKYRGAAPIQWAVAMGEPVTGATTMRIDEGLDTGDILLQREMAIAPNMTSETLFPLLAEMGADLMVQTLAGLERGEIEARPQDHALATLAPILTRDDGRVDFTRSAMDIYNRWRGFQPWPGAWTIFQGKKLALHQLMPDSPKVTVAVEPGMMMLDADRLYVACGEDTWLQILELQVEGKKRMAAKDFLHGYPRVSETRLGI